ncbi:hypothetical protein BLA18112_00354 [Burkholderia lata]|uniref:Uncharacterized protein n=1 Tax=Burkholderia lata (strain ATCC 17760 / DSM 23089 / LMG 22485 / NCIMB 9086 / R18194 / 383) TaxID=482957 RepID=A0A6P2SZL1_BURL3|nr:hypothetical protein BLA18112_00354 [Burkholderia lata]
MTHNRIVAVFMRSAQETCDTVNSFFTDLFTGSAKQIQANFMKEGTLTINRDGPYTADCQMTLFAYSYRVFR